MLSPTLPQSQTSEKRDNLYARDVVIPSPSIPVSQKSNEFVFVDYNATLSSNGYGSDTASDSDFASDSELESQTDTEETILKEKGYRKITKIRNILQGELILAEVLHRSNNIKARKHANAHITRKVTIKKINKTLHEQRIEIKDGMTFCVTNDVNKEAMILHHLSIANRSAANYIIKYIESFESATDIYLVQEYIPNSVTLNAFVTKAHDLIQKGQLKIKQYQKITKYIFWQLFVVTRWMHEDMNCCHLGLTLDNIILKDADFILNTKTNKITINPSISVKIANFGAAEIWDIHEDNNTFQCNKHTMSLDSSYLSSPQLFADEKYDAKKADIWSLGLILFHCIIGKPLYCVIDNDKMSGYMALKNGRNQLKKYLQINNATKFITSKVFDLLINVLKFEENERYKIINILQHDWFTSYYLKYKERIEKKSISQRERLKQQAFRMRKFPYYKFR